MAHTESQPVSPEMQRCIDLCLECHRVCIETTSHCLSMGGKHAEATHIRRLLDCAQACQLAAELMMRGSDLAGRTCALCAEFCDLCARTCEQLRGDDAQMTRCADTCRRCAEACRNMQA